MAEAEVVKALKGWRKWVESCARRGRGFMASWLWGQYKVDFWCWICQSLGSDAMGAEIGGGGGVKV